MANRIVVTDDEYVRLLKDAIRRDEEYLAMCQDGLRTVLENISYYEKKIAQQKQTLADFLANRTSVLK